jgi:SAM-dependent methyltransferase
VAALRLAADLTGGLPFQDGTFDGVVASLSLHYFRSLDTQQAIREIARVLAPSGWLLCRVNAVGDVNFGYGSGEEVEPSLFRQPEGHLKRFFDEPMLSRFLEPCFRLDKITSRTILQRGLEKRTLESVARKR